MRSTQKSTVKEVAMLLVPTEVIDFSNKLYIENDKQLHKRIAELDELLERLDAGESELEGVILMYSDAIEHYEDQNIKIDAPSPEAVMKVLMEEHRRIRP
jgi:antitoxin component HigA of HigAB toxin-antitoxin module